jgi:hypothetical protein
LLRPVFNIVGASKSRLPFFVVTAIAAAASFAMPHAAGIQAAGQNDMAQDFRTADRCFTCHNNLKTAKGEDVSIGLEWSASMMANAARDPYWQGSVRREVIEHPESSAAIQNECATCHMPLQNLLDKAQGHQTEMFKQLPLGPEHAAAADGVSCAVCHQIQATGLGTPATYNGNIVVAAPDVHPRPAFGPYAADPDRVMKVHVMTTGYAPTQADQMRDAGLCGSCHTLYTTTRGPDGKEIGKLPEQMPYLEWLHGDYKDKQTCQQCHMAAVNGPVVIASLLSQPREGVRQHGFLGANFLVDGMLSAHHDELAVSADPAQLAAETARVTAFLQSQAAKVTVEPASVADGTLSFAVRVENLTGHKLPTAFPSRRAWLHVVVTAADGQVVFESGKLNADGSIAGNANDADPARYSPHYTKITKADEVEIFEPILGDSQDHVTTGLLSATHYLKDNRILPAGFDKKTAVQDIAVQGEAADDSEFTAGSSTTHYAIATSGAAGPFKVAAELVYQPVGYRWAHNLESFKAEEPQRFVHYYEQAAAHSALVLAHAETTVSAEQ